MDFIYIDDQRVHVSDLSDEEKHLVSLLTDINNKMAQLQLSAEQLNAARAVFSDKLVAGRKKQQQGEEVSVA